MMTRSHLCGKVQEWQGASGSGDLWGRLSYCGEDRQSSQQLACGRSNGRRWEARKNWGTLGHNFITVHNHITVIV